MSIFRIYINLLEGIYIYTDYHWVIAMYNVLQRSYKLCLNRKKVIHSSGLGPGYSCHNLPRLLQVQEQAVLRCCWGGHRRRARLLPGWSTGWWILVIAPLLVDFWANDRSDTTAWFCYVLLGGVFNISYLGGRDYLNCFCVPSRKQG